MPERDSLEFDILFVGAGPASLAGAYHLSRLIEEHNSCIERGVRGGQKLGEISIAVIEKGREVNSHSFSGAILDPRALRELIPDFAKRGAPVVTPVVKDRIYYLTERGKCPLPLIPPPMSNHGNYVVSLGKFVAWLAEQCEEKGINVFPEFPGVELLFDGDRVVGVHSGDKGLDKDGRPKANYEPGPDLFAKVTVLGEGPRGTLTKRLVKKCHLDAGRAPQVYSLGMKETWQLATDRLPEGMVTHTLGYPLGPKLFGGGFLYMRRDGVLDVGLVVGLEYEDPRTDPHWLFGKWKQHPLVADLLHGAKLVSYGAKAIPEGGLFSQPRLLHDGVMIIGDAASFLNSQRLKGIHLAMKSGMLAAEAIFECFLANDFSLAGLESYPEKYRRSWAYEELYRVRNFHQAFHGGLFAGTLHAALQMISGGRGLRDPWPIGAGHERMRKLGVISAQESGGRTEGRMEGRGGSVATSIPLPPPHPSPSPFLPSSEKQYDPSITFDKLTDVFHSNTSHDEDQPCHLHVLDVNVCKDRCTYEYGNPCQYFCPAAVYEIVPREGGNIPFIHFSNCVHCKTCDIMDPYQIIDWVPPQGGDGPNYKNM